MKRIFVFMTAIALIAFGAAETIANDQVAVIVNINNPVTSLSTKQIKNIYENNRLHWDHGAPIILYDLGIKDSAREFFSKNVIGKSARKVAEKWAHLKITNQAINPPINVRNRKFIIKRVSREKGAIGYVPLNEVKKSENHAVKIVAVIYP